MGGNGQSAGWDREEGLRWQDLGCLRAQGRRGRVGLCLGIGVWGKMTRGELQEAGRLVTLEGTVCWKVPLGGQDAGDRAGLPGK